MFDKRRQRNSQEIEKVNKWNFPKACFSYNYGHGHRKLATKPPKPKIIRLNSEKILIFYFQSKILKIILMSNFRKFTLNMIFINFSVISNFELVWKNVKFIFRVNFRKFYVSDISEIDREMSDFSLFVICKIGLFWFRLIRKCKILGIHPTESSLDLASSECLEGYLSNECTHWFLSHLLTHDGLKSDGNKK